MNKKILLNDWDLKQLEVNGSVQSGNLMIIRKDIYDKIFDDTFIRLDDEVLKRFKKFCKVESKKQLIKEAKEN